MKKIYEKSFKPGAITDAEYREFMNMYMGRGATEQIQAFERKLRGKTLEEQTRGIQTEEGALRQDMERYGRTLEGMGRVQDTYSRLWRKMPYGFGGGIPGEGATAADQRRVFFSELTRGVIAEQGGMVNWLPFGTESIVGRWAARARGIPSLDEMERRYQRGAPPLPLDFLPDGELGERRRTQIENILRGIEETSARNQAETSATVPATTPNASGNSSKTEQRINAANVQMGGATLQNGRQTEPD